MKSLLVRACLLGVALWCTFQAQAAVAHPTSFCADPPIPYTDRAVALADQWITDDVSECTRFRVAADYNLRAASDVLREAFRKPADIDAGSPEDVLVNDEEDRYDRGDAPDAATDNNLSDDSAADNENNFNQAERNLYVPLIVLSEKGLEPEEFDDSIYDENVGIWKTIQENFLDAFPANIIGGFDSGFVPNISIGNAAVAFDLVLAAPATESNGVALNQCNDALRLNCELTASTTNPFASIQAWPSVTDEATARSILGPQTTASLIDIGRFNTAERQNEISLDTTMYYPGETELSAPSNDSSSAEENLLFENPEFYKASDLDDSTPDFTTEGNPSANNAWELED